MPRSRQAFKTAFVMVLLLLVAIYAQSVKVRASLPPITDLPFYGSYQLTCGWHVNCHNGAVQHGSPPHTDNHGFNASEGGVDIGIPVGTSLFAPGHGTVIFGGDQGLYGTVVDIDHGSEDSKSAHLSYNFFSGGERICRHVAIGYSGHSTSDPNGVGPHVHFEGERNPHFAPIHGAQPGTFDDNFFNFDPFADQCCPTVIHSGVETRAWTVDDKQAGFELFVPGGLAQNWQQHVGNGFGYSGQGNATYWTSPMGNTQPFNHARWTADLNNPTNEDWDIYVFIPDSGSEQGPNGGPATLSVTAVKYKVVWFESGNLMQYDFFISQAGSKNVWVRLQDQTRSTFHVDANTDPGVLLVARCPNCQPTGELVAADAALFIPANCGP